MYRFSLARKLKYIYKKRYIKNKKYNNIKTSLNQHLKDTLL